MHFLISGIPASGKSTYCRWLEEKKGFLHLNVEEDGVLDRHGLAAEWLALFGAGSSAASFVQAVDKLKRPVGIDWGFPPEHLDTVRKLFDGGVMLWWIAADLAVARRKVKERGTIPVGLFDIQIRKIEANLPEINALFRSHVEYALPSRASAPHPTKSGRACSTPWPDPPDTEPPEGARPPHPPSNQKALLPRPVSSQQPHRIRDPNFLKNPAQIPPTP